MLHEVLSTFTADEKKVVNKWCVREKEVQLPQYYVGAPENEIKRLLVELKKAKASDNWTYFDPEANNPSKGQAVRTEEVSGDEAVDESEPEPANEEEEGDDASEDDPEPVYAEPRAAASPGAGDPLVGLVDAIAERLEARFRSAPVSQDMGQVIDHHLQNGGFPVKRVQELIDEQLISHVTAYLCSQPEEIVEQAIERWEEGR